MSFCMEVGMMVTNKYLMFKAISQRVTEISDVVQKVNRNLMS